MPLIVLEGLDGAGKSTQLTKLQELLRTKGMAYEYLHFPRFDAPFYGDLIARFLRGELGEIDRVDPYIVALLYAGDRADAASLIHSWIDEGKYVILDRYVYSNIAFQGAKTPPEKLEALTRWILDFEFGYNRLPRPDVQIFMDVPFEFTRSRLCGQRKGDDRNYLNGANDIHEASLDFQRRVRDVYLACARRGDINIVDCADKSGAMLPPDAIFDLIRKQLSI